MAKQAKGLSYAVAQLASQVGKNNQLLAKALGETPKHSLYTIEHISDAMLAVADKVNENNQLLTQLVERAGESSTSSANTQNAPLIWRGTIQVPEAQQKSHDITFAIPEMFRRKPFTLHYNTNPAYRSYSVRYYDTHRQSESIQLVDGYSNWHGVSQIEVILVHIDLSHYEPQDTRALVQYKWVDQDELY